MLKRIISYFKDNRGDILFFAIFVLFILACLFGTIAWLKSDPTGNDRKDRWQKQEIIEIIKEYEASKEAGE